METKLYGYEEHMLTLVDTTKATTRQVIFWLHHQTLQRKEMSIRIHQCHILISKGLFLFCSRDKADRHTPILIEDENLFTAFDDLPLDDT